MGLFGTIARAARAAFSGRAAATTAKAAKRATAGANLFERAAERARNFRESRRAAKQPYKGISIDTLEKVFYERTQKLWQGSPTGQRIERILEGLGVSSLEDAKQLVLSDVMKQLEGQFNSKWYAMTDDEKYRHILSILVRR